MANQKHKDKPVELSRLLWEPHPVYNYAIISTRRWRDGGQAGHIVRFASEKKRNDWLEQTYGRAYAKKKLKLTCLRIETGGGRLR